MLFCTLVKHIIRWNMSYFLMKVVFISNNEFGTSLKQFLLTFLKKKFSWQKKFLIILSLVSSSLLFKENWKLVHSQKLLSSILTIDSDVLGTISVDKKFDTRYIDFPQIFKESPLFLFSKNGHPTYTFLIFEF